MKKLIFVFLFPILLFAQTDLPATRVRVDTIKAFKTTYGTLDSIHIKSRTKFYRPAEFDSTVVFFVPVARAYINAKIALINGLSDSSVTFRVDTISTTGVPVYSASSPNIDLRLPFARMKQISWTTGLQDTLNDRYRRGDTATVLLSKENAATAYVPLARTITISGNSPLSFSAGAQDLSANRTWTGSLDTSTYPTGVPTLYKTRQDSITAVAHLEDTTLLSPFLAYKNQQNIFTEPQYLDTLRGRVDNIIVDSGMIVKNKGIKITGSGIGDFRADVGIEVQGVEAGFSVFQTTNPGTTAHEGFWVYGAYDAAGAIKKTASVSSKWSDSSSGTGYGVLRLNATYDGGDNDNVALRIFGNNGVSVFGDGDTDIPGANILLVRGAITAFTTGTHRFNVGTDKNLRIYNDGSTMRYDFDNDASSAYIPITFNASSYNFLSGNLLADEKIVSNDSLRVGTSTPAKINNNGSFTGLNVSNFDTVATDKLKFKSHISSVFPIQPMQMFADTTEQNALYYDAYLVRRTVDLTHNVLPDSIRVTGTTRTALDTIVMAARFLRAGKIIVTSYHGQYDAPSAGKTFDVTIRKGSINGTLIDSIRYTTSDGATNQPFMLENVIDFRTVGASGRFHSDTELRVNGRANLMDSNVGTIDTDASENLIFVVISMDDASSWFQLDRGYTTTKN